MMRSRKIAWLGALAATAAAAIALPALALGGARAASTHTVSLRNFAFHPSTLNLNHGESVKWVWRDETDHNVTFRSFHSRTQEHGSYTVRFAHRGTFKYVCTIHSSLGMRGKVVVH
jgi:plastocyanin